MMKVWTGPPIDPTLLMDIVFLLKAANLTNPALVSEEPITIQNLCQHKTKSSKISNIELA